MIDTFNKFLVGAHGDDVVFLLPVPKKLSQADALLLAAWLVAIANPQSPEGERFEDVLKALEST